MDNLNLEGKNIGFAMTGSFCNLEPALQQMECLKKLGANIIPIISTNVANLDSRFGTAAYWRKRILAVTDNAVIIDTISLAEPIGPKRLCDTLIIAPCTGNSLSKLANGVIDTPVVMAAKSHLRNNLPLVIAISTNDGLGVNAKNIGLLLNYQNLFFVPFGQDNPANKPKSLIAIMEKIPETLALALNNQQIQPLLACQIDPKVV